MIFAIYYRAHQDSISEQRFLSAMLYAIYSDESLFNMGTRMVDREEAEEIYHNASWGGCIHRGCKSQLWPRDT